MVSLGHALHGGQSVQVDGHFVLPVLNGEVVPPGGYTDTVRPHLLTTGRGRGESGGRAKLCACACERKRERGREGRGV